MSIAAADELRPEDARVLTPPLAWGEPLPDLGAQQPLPFHHPPPRVEREEPVDHRLRTELTARLVVVLEVVARRRSPAQAARWMTVSAADGLRDMLTASSDVWRLRSMHCQRPHTDVVEVSAHAVAGGRSAALAARFERRRGLWVCARLTARL